MAVQRQHAVGLVNQVSRSRKVLEVKLQEPQSTPKLYNEQKGVFFGEGEGGLDGGGSGLRGRGGGE